MNLIKRTIRYLSPFKGNIILIFLFNLLYSLFSLFSLTMVIPFLSVLFGESERITVKPELAFNSESIINTFYYYMGNVIESNGPVRTLFLVALFMIVFSLFSNLFRYLAIYCVAPIRAGIIKNIRKEIYHKLIILPLSFFSQFKRGDIINRFGTDVQEVEWSVVATLQTFCRDPFLLLIYLITLCMINIKLTVITLIILPLSGLIITFVGRYIKRYSARAQEVLGKLSSKFEEAIGGLRIIKAYNAIEHASGKFENENKYFSRVNTKLYRVNELGSPLIEFLSILSLTLILLIGSRFVLDDPNFKGGLFIMYIIVFARMLPPAKQLVTAHYTIQKGMASAKRIYQVLDSEEKIMEAEEPVEIKNFADRIDYQDVSFSYQENNTVHSNPDVLKNITFSIKKGDIIALTGPSGGGKSTLVDLLPRFYDITDGQILIDGMDIRQLKVRDLRDLFGIVNQDVILFHDTVFNNIAFGKKEVTKEEVIEAAKIAQAHDFIMEMEHGYNTIIGDRGLKLSGGQRQRLSIARTILKDPQILILDEATSALDAKSEYMVQQSLEDLIKGRTAIIVAHRLSTIRNADQILFIEDGQIKEQGTHAELMENKGSYYQFCSLQEIK